MPGALEHVEGEVVEQRANEGWVSFNVLGLQRILEKFKGKRVRITVEEVDE